MSLWIDAKYVGFLSGRLERFTNKGKFKYNFRCPICGDSKKKTQKARGYIFEKSGNLIYKCHNCSVSLSLQNLIKEIDPVLYKEYTLEKFKEKKGAKVEQKKFDFAPKFKKPSSKKEPVMRIISSLNECHSAFQYLEKRNIPKKHYDILCYVEDFKKLVDTLSPDNDYKLKDNEERIIIPFLDKKGKLFGFQGRSIDKNCDLRYITIMLSQKPKVFGLYGLDESKPIYVLEGPFDSLFIPNSIAMCGADLPVELRDKNLIFVYDNEPRNPQIIKRMHQISKSFKVCVWGNSMKGKDINEMILNGHAPMKIKEYIDNNHYSGLSAKMAIMEWKKI
jgi:transcription elongation factor Elf1